jgi:predicted peroxiredoxin
MARLLFVLPHSTDDPDRAAAGLLTALAAAEAGHDVALWLAGEGVRLGLKAVAETLREPYPRSAAEMVEALVSRGTALHVARAAFERRDLSTAPLRPGARLSDDAELAALVASGRVPVTL